MNTYTRKATTMFNLSLTTDAMFNEREIPMEYFREMRYDRTLPWQLVHTTGLGKPIYSSFADKQSMLEAEQRWIDETILPCKIVATGPDGYYTATVSNRFLLKTDNLKYGRRLTLGEEINRELFKMGGE